MTDQKPKGAWGASVMLNDGITPVTTAEYVIDELRLTRKEAMLAVQEASGRAPAEKTGTIAAI